MSCLCCSASLLLLLRSSSSVRLMVPLQPGLQKSFRRSSHAQRKSIFSQTIYSWRMRKFTKICVSVCLCLYVCVCLLVCLSVCLYVCLYVYQFICLNMLPNFFLKLLFTMFCCISNILRNHAILTDNRDLA